MTRLLRDMVPMWMTRNDSISSKLRGGSQQISTKGGTSARNAPTEPVESAAAARRRAERALAEQRRADLELLEARRQQRKLNFLLTQTELYAHFMAKTMNKAGGEIEANPVDTDVDSILQRLQDAPKPPTDEGTAEPTNQESSLAEAAKAAADRLGVNVEEEFGEKSAKTSPFNNIFTHLISFIIYSD